MGDWRILTILTMVVRMVRMVRIEEVMRLACARPMSETCAAASAMLLATCVALVNSQVL